MSWEPALLLATAMVIGMVRPAMADLPEGEGLAAKYPGDRGIEKDPAVVFADDYETVTSSRLTHGFAKSLGGKWNNKWDHVWGENLVTTDKKHVHAGKKALEIVMDHPNSIGMSKYFEPGFETVFLRYYAKYDAEFPGAHHVGGAVEARAPGVPHANAGVEATGANKFSVLLDHWSFEENIPAPGWQVIYCYHLDQKHKWGEQFFPSGKIQPGTNMHLKLFGDKFVPRPDFIPEKDRWYCFELMVKVNDPDKRNGRVAFWVDGRLAGDFPNIRLRNAASLKANRIDLGMYESRENGRHRIWFDDVVAATSYIGPLVSAASKER